MVGQTSQSPEHRYRQKSFGFNMSGLLAGFIPFGGNNPTEVGPVSFRVKSFRERFAWRTGIGFHVSDFIEIDDGTQNYISIYFGAEWQRELVPQLRMLYGVDLFLGAGGFNLPGGDENEFAGPGLAPFVGLEYFIDRPVSVSVESSLMFGPNANGGTVLRTIPPIAVNLHLYWDKRLRPKRRRR